MNYEKIVSHYEECFHKYGDCHKGVDWPNEKDVLKRYRVMLDVIGYDTANEKAEKPSVLDFGCGLAHLYQFILDNDYILQYSGLDISDEFIDVCKRKFPEEEFIKMDILKDDYKTLNGKYDYIVMNGVFTERVGIEFDLMKHYFEEMIRRTFEICRRGIAFNVMSKDVDWEREDLFHLPLNELSAFLTKNVTRKFVIRNDYGLYEYTTYVYKD